MATTVFCGTCENKPVFAKGNCKSCYNKQYWVNATDAMLQKRRTQVKESFRRSKTAGYIPRSRRTKQSEAERIKLSATLNKIRRNNRQNTINSIKLQSGCVDCGYNEHPIALDFDHIDGKNFSISRAISRGYPFEQILDELKRCEVRCANCHRIVTAKRRNKEL